MRARRKHHYPGPGKASRKGLSIVQLIRMFPDDKVAEAWIASLRWPTGAVCPHCASANVQCGAKHPSMSYRCRTCRKFFSVRTDTVMQNSNLGAQKWVIAAYMLSTNLKGDSSMKLHRDLDITQKSAWHLAHRMGLICQSAQKRNLAGMFRASEMARSLAHVIVCAIALPLNFVAEILRFEDRVHHQLEISGWPRDRNAASVFVVKRIAREKW